MKLFMTLFCTTCLLLGCQSPSTNTSSVAPVAEEGIRANKTLLGWYFLNVDTTLANANRAFSTIEKKWQLRYVKRTFNGYRYNYEFTSNDNFTYKVELLYTKKEGVRVSTFVSKNKITSDAELSCNLLSDILVVLGVDFSSPQTK